MFRFSGQELRQDPQSHHLILNRYFGTASPHDPAFGAWTCNGGARAGQTCEPTDLTSCGDGTCTSAIQQSFACIGFGPSNGGGQGFFAIGGAQKAQAAVNYVDGVFAQIPMKGILYWNSHAFNLTDEDTTMHARLNYYFASSQRYPIQPIFNHQRDLQRRCGTLHDADDLQRPAAAAGRAPVRALVAHPQARQGVHGDRA